MTIRLNRRSMLAQLAAAGVGLPMLEVGAREQSASSSGSDIPRRFVLVYCGVSTGRDGSGQNIVPQTAGAGYDLTRPLWSLGKPGEIPVPDLAYGGSGWDVQQHVSIVSGLRIGANMSGSTPPGGRSPEFHYNTVGSQISGRNNGSVRSARPKGPSADQIAADAIGGGTNHRVLTYRVQAAGYVGDSGGSGDSGVISWAADGNDVAAVQPVVSPKLAWEILFSGADAGATPEELSALARRKRVVDRVHERTRSLALRLGGRDRERLEQHLAQLEAMQAQIDGGGSCTPFAHPGEDPSVGGGHGTDGGVLDYDEDAGYSNEQRRAELLFDITQMAFSCRMSNVASIRMTIDQSFLNMKPLVGALSDLHELTHGQATAEGHADGLGWHVHHLARFVRNLADSPEVDGSSLLDHTAIVMLFEGGHGYDPETGSQNHAHSTENMIALVAGHAGGLAGGLHVREDGAHPAQAVLTAMQAAGVPTDSLGDFDSGIDGLFV